MKQLQSIFLAPFISIFIFLVSFQTASAQVENDTILASQYFNKADSLLVDRKYDESIKLFKKALPIYTKAKAWKKVVNCYNKLAENQWENRKLEQSIQNSKKALHIIDTHFENNSEERATTYDNMGYYYESIPEYDTAKTYYQKALEIRQKILQEEHPDIAVSYNNLGVVHYYTAEYKTALQYYKKALAILLKTLGPDNPKTGICYNNIGIIYYLMGNLSKAIEYYKKTVVITIKESGENHLRVGLCYTNIGVAYNILNQRDNALNYYQKALAIFIENEFLDGVSNIYRNIGVILYDQGKYDEALQYYKKSIGIRQEVFGENHPEVATVYTGIGVLFFSKGDNEKALQNLNKALNIYKASQGENHDDVALLYSDIGNVYTRYKDYDIALKYHKKSLSIYKLIFDSINPKLTKLHNSIANLYIYKKEYRNALFHCEKGLNILLSAYGEQHPLTATAYNDVASIYNEQEDYTTAILNFDKALLANSKDKDQKDIENTFDPSQYYDSKLVLETLQGKATALRLRYQRNKDKQDLDQSIAINQNASVLINYIRQSYRNYQDKISFSKQANETYANAIKTHLYLNKQTHEQKSLEDAFYYAEKGKFNTLKEQLNDSDAKSISGLSLGLMKMEKELKTNQAFYQSQIIDQLSSTSTDSTKIKDFENELFDINRRQDSLTKILEKNYPKYYQLKHQSNIISVAEIQEKLGNNQTLLEFFVADSVSYVFTISKNDLQVKELYTAKLAMQIEEYRNSITSKNMKEYKKQGHQLFNKLMDPIKDNFVGDELIIVPDGPLWHLNFELLLTQNDNTNNPKELSYLLKNYAISYANSANLLFNPFKSELQSEKQQECLAFSFSDSANISNANTMSLATLRNTGDDLPGTRKEIKAIADIINGQYYYGSEAVEANFKKNANKYNILHLALHGEVDNERPENSKLYFTKSKDTLEDNLLYSHELFALNIPAELVVLSACNTGSGKIAKGEGIMSLGSAFQYAGTKSLLLTSWEVSDQTTPELMKHFYTNLKAGMNKAKALQQAKLQYLKTADTFTNDPFYWGGFYLVGDTSPIHFNDNSQLYWILGLGILACLFLIVFWYRKNSTKR